MPQEIDDIATRNKQDDRKQRADYPRASNFAQPHRPCLSAISTNTTVRIEFPTQSFRHDRTDGYQQLRHADVAPRSALARPTF